MKESRCQHSNTHFSHPERTDTSQNHYTQRVWKHSPKNRCCVSQKTQSAHRDSSRLRHNKTHSLACCQRLTCVQLLDTIATTGGYNTTAATATNTAFTSAVVAVVVVDVVVVVVDVLACGYAHKTCARFRHNIAMR